jgi:putative transposase
LIALGVDELVPVIGTRDACAALGMPRASWYRRHRGRRHGPPKPRPAPPRALSDPERAAVLAELHADRFADTAPAAVYAALLDEGACLASQRTMYRILAANAEVRERRDQLRHPVYARPELLATGPRELMSWDITKLRGPAKWTHCHLYVILDVFSRYAPGWMVATRESAVLAERLIRETAAKEGIEPGQLTVRADRGTSMRSKDVALLLADLGIGQSRSRPHVSNDNPYSEAAFKTLKYRPAFPDRFGSLEDARAFCTTFFTWYNTVHRHAGIGLLTPADVHAGRAPEITAARAVTLDAAYAAHPERFVRRPPTPPVLPTAVWINPPPTKETPPQ